MKPWVIVRRTSQIIFLLLFVYILWSTTYPLTGNLPTEAFFKIDPFIVMITSISERLILPGMAFCIIMCVLTVILGRFFCGWICPMGTVIDGMGSFRKSKAYHGFNTPTRGMRFIKFALLGCTALCAFFGIQIAWIFDPLVITARFVSINFIPVVTSSIDSVFIFFIRHFQLYGPLYDFYRALKSTFLGIKPYYFSHSLSIAVFFITVISTALIMQRFWCRAVCPLGAWYALCSRFSFLKRIVSPCSDSETCISSCRMGAIINNSDYRPGECILCMDCLYDCPQHPTRFGWKRSRIPPVNDDHPSHGISRRQFLLFGSSSVLLSGFQMRKRHRHGREISPVIRPPGSLAEEHFCDRCIRCGNCMKVCITNGLQPVMLESGLAGIWTPQLLPTIGYCEYNCTLCGQVCPTNAIPRLPVEKKRKMRLGLANINRRTCWPWAEGKECIVCEEHCPIPDKAIYLQSEKHGSTTILKPYVNPKTCNGCGICQTKCPARPFRAIQVASFPSDRT